MRVSAAGDADAESFEIGHRLGHLQGRHQAVDDRHFIDTGDAGPGDCLAQVQLPGNNCLGAPRDRFARGGDEPVDQRVGLALRIADIPEGGIHQYGGQRALGEPELANAQIHHLVESRLKSDNDKLAAKRAGKMHRGLAVADDGNIQQ